MKFITRVSTLTTVEAVVINTNDEVSTMLVEVYGITPNEKKFESVVKKTCEENDCILVRIKEVVETRNIKFMMDQQEFYKNAIKKNIEKN